MDETSNCVLCVELCVAKLRKLLAAVRVRAEYAHGYNSSEWVSGRREGIEMAIAVLTQELPDFGAAREQALEPRK